MKQIIAASAALYLWAQPLNAYAQTVNPVSPVTAKAAIDAATSTSAPPIVKPTLNGILTDILGAVVYSQTNFNFTGLALDAGTTLGRALSTRAQDVVNIKDCGVRSDLTSSSSSALVTANTLAIQTCFNNLTSGQKLEIPYGTYIFDDSQVTANIARGYTSPSTALAIPRLDAISIVGAGQNASIFEYNGTLANIDLISTGDGTNAVNSTGWTIQGLRIHSLKQMSQGYGFHFHRLSDTYLHGIMADGFGLPGNNQYLHSGLYFDGVHAVFMEQWGAYTQFDGLAVRGIDSSSNANLMLLQGYSDFNGNVGIHVAGDVGGLFVDQTESLSNTFANLAIDNTLNSTPLTSDTANNTAGANREILIGPTFVSDGINVSTHGVYVNDTIATGGQSINMNGFIGSSVDGIRIISWPAGVVAINSNRIFNNQRDGVRVEDATTVVNIGSGTIINANGWSPVDGSAQGWAINATVPTDNITFSGLGSVVAGYRSANALGDFAPNTHVGWQTVTGSGYLTNNGGPGVLPTTYGVSIRYRKNGPNLDYVATVTVSANGSGAGPLYLMMPYAAKVVEPGSGTATAATTYPLLSQTNAASALIFIAKTDGTYPIASTGTTTLTFSGSYERN